eukprot:243790_1
MASSLAVLVENLSVNIKSPHDHDEPAAKRKKRGKRVSITLPIRANANNKIKKRLRRRLSVPIRLNIQFTDEDDNKEEEHRIAENVNTYQDQLCVNTRQILKTKHNTFTVLQDTKIGEGTFAGVYVCANTQNQEQYAIKIRKESDNKFQSATNKYRIHIFQHEIKILNRIKPNKYVCTLLDYQNTDFMILELGEYSLSDLIDNCGGLTEQEAAKCTVIIAKIIQHLMSKNIVHLDIKSDNFVYIQNRLKIIDFGEAWHGDINCVDKVGGSPVYQSPEMLLMAECMDDEEKQEIVKQSPGILNVGYCNWKTDLWSVG